MDDDSWSKKVVSPLLEGGEEGQELSLVSWVVALGGTELLRHAWDELHAFMLVGLVESGADRILAHVDV